MFVLVHTLGAAYAFCANIRKRYVSTIVLMKKDANVSQQVPDRYYKVAPGKEDFTPNKFQIGFTVMVDRVELAQS